MFILNNRNVGIGTITPSYKLHVASNGGYLAYFQNTSATDYRPVGFTDENNAVVGSIGYNTSNNVFSVGDTTGPVVNLVGGKVGINKTPNSAVTLSVNAPASNTTNYGLEICNASANTRFLVDGVGNTSFYGSDNSLSARVTSDGNVGIGTTAPAGKLHVIDSYAGERNIFLDNPNASGVMQLNIRAGTGNEYLSLLRSTTSASIQVATDPLYIKHYHSGAWHNSIVVAADGKIGMGTSAPGSYWASADDLVIATTGNTGMTLVAGTTSSSSAIAFADGTGSSAYRGRIEYNHSTDKLMLGAGGTTPFAIKGDGNTSLPDNSKALFGTGDDLQIYHDGSNSYIKNQIGWINMPLSQNGLSIANADFSELIATFRVNGSCDLYYDGSKKLETTSTGASVTGDISFSGDLLSSSGGNMDITHPTASQNIVFKTTPSGGSATERVRITHDGHLSFLSDLGRIKMGLGGDLQIYHNGSVSQIRNENGNLDIEQHANDGNIRFYCDDGSGGVELYFYLDGSDATANPQTIFPDNSYLNFGTSGDLKIYHDGSNSYITDSGTGDLKLLSSGLAIQSANGNEYLAYFAGTGGQTVSLYAGNSKKFETTSTGVTITGQLSATTKSFLIDHPTKPGKKLRHGSLEGPENGVYIRGKGKTSIIELPEYWTELVDEDSITVQLTPIGKHQHIYVESIKNNTVHVQSDETRKNSNDLEYFYLILAERKDVDKLVIEE